MRSTPFNQECGSRGTAAGASRRPAPWLCSWVIRAVRRGCVTPRVGRLAVALLLPGAVCGGAALGLQRWAHRMPIVFEGYEKPDTLTDFPALVVLHEDIPGFSYDELASPTGGDLRFTTADRTAFLDHECEHWDTEGRSYVWVRVPQLSRGTAIWAHWGNPAATRPPPYTTDGSTWAERYAAVWHLNDGPPKTATQLTCRDSSAHGNHGRGQATGRRHDGRVGPGLELDGSGDGIACGNDASLNARNAVTVELWLRHVGGDYRGVINKGCWKSGPWELRFGREGMPRGTRLGARVNTDQGSLGLDLYPSANEWHHVALVYDGSAVSCYLDGRCEASGRLSGRMRLVDTPVTIGQNGANRERYAGALDEVRITGAARPPGWVWASWLSQARPDEFAVCNVVVTNGLGATQVTTSSAHLNGHLYGTHGLPTDVTVFWGDNDGGSDEASWDNCLRLSRRTEPGPLGTAVPVEPDKDWCYRFRASSSAGEFWAPRTSTFATPSVAGTTTDGVVWVATFEGDALPQPPQWTREGEARTEAVAGGLSIVDSSPDDACWYRATWNDRRQSTLIVDARLRVLPTAAPPEPGGGGGALPNGAGASVAILLSNEGRQGGLTLQPDHISATPDRFCRMDTTDGFHTYRLVVSGRDMSVYVDGRLKVRGLDAFSGAAAGMGSSVRFGSHSKPGTGAACWDFVRAGVRRGLATENTAGVSVTLSEPWRVSGSERSTRPSVCSVGDGILLLSVADADVFRHRFSLLMSTDQGRSWVPVPGFAGKTFAPQSFVRLDPGSILGLCRPTVDCLNSHSGRCVALAGVSFELDRRLDPARMVESRIVVGPRLTRRVTFGRTALKLEDGSVLATASNERDGCLLLRTPDRGSTWHVLSRIGAGRDASVALLSETEATAVVSGGTAMPFRQVWSDTGGRNWSKPVVLEEGTVVGDLVSMSNGVLACSYGDPGCGVMFSTDRGRTWGSHRIVADRERAGQTTICEISPGRLLYVHGPPPLTARHIDVRSNE